MLNEEYAHFVRPATSSGQSYLASDQLFSRRIETLELRPVVLCAAYTPIHEVARRMAEARTSCYFITNADVDGHIIGFVTDITLRDKVVAGQADASQPVETIVDAPVVSISSRAFVYEAILLMFRTKTRYSAGRNRWRIRGLHQPQQAADRRPGASRRSSSFSR